MSEPTTTKTDSNLAVNKAVADVDFVDDVLANVLLDPVYAKTAIPHLDPEHMPTDSHRHIVSVIRDIFDKHRELPTAKIAASKLAQEVKRKEDRAAVKLLWAKIENIKPTAPRAALDEIKRFAKTQGTLRQWSEAGVALKQGNVDAALEIMGKAATPDLDSMDAIEITSWMEGFEARQEARKNQAENPDSGLFVLTGIEGLDRHLNGGAGLRQEQVGGILAVTNRGKSVLITNFGYRGICDGRKVVHVTTEMSAAEVSERYDVRWLGIASDKFPHYKFSEDELKIIERMRKEGHRKFDGLLKVVGCPVDSTTKRSMRWIVEEAREQMGGCDLFLFDSPDHMKAGRQSFGKDAYRLEQASNFWWVKSICQEFNMAGWVTVQAGSQAANSTAKAEDVNEAYDKARILNVLFSLNSADDNNRGRGKHEVTMSEWDGGEEIRPSRSGLRGFLDKNRHGPAKVEVPLETDLDRMLIVDGATGFDTPMRPITTKGKFKQH